MINDNSKHSIVLIIVYVIFIVALRKPSLITKLPVINHENSVVGASLFG